MSKRIAFITLIAAAGAALPALALPQSTPQQRSAAADHVIQTLAVANTGGFLVEQTIGGKKRLVALTPVEFDNLVNGLKRSGALSPRDEAAFVQYARQESNRNTAEANRRYNVLRERGVVPGWEESIRRQAANALNGPSPAPGPQQYDQNGRLRAPTPAERAAIEAELRRGEFADAARANARGTAPSLGEVASSIGALLPKGFGSDLLPQDMKDAAKAEGAAAVAGGSNNPFFNAGASVLDAYETQRKKEMEAENFRKMLEEQSRGSGGRYNPPSTASNTTSPITAVPLAPLSAQDQSYMDAVGRGDYLIRRRDNGVIQIVSKREMEAELADLLAKGRAQKPGLEDIGGITPAEAADMRRLAENDTRTIVQEIEARQRAGR